MTASGSPVVDGGRRRRNKAEKQQRIFAAAGALLAERGYEHVTTQEISDAADVAIGTLFRYAATKAELLLMVYNETFRSAIAAGRQAAAAEPDPVQAILQLLQPVMRHTGEQPRNTVAYQRELVYGRPSQRYRAEGLALVAELQRAIAELLLRDAPDRGAGQGTAEAAAARASRSIFAVVHLLLVQTATGPLIEADLVGELPDQVAQIHAGFMAGLTTHRRRPGPEGKPEKRTNGK